MKELLVYQGPVSSRSGYGDHARDVLRSFIKMDRFNIKVVDTPWGACPRNGLDREKDKDITDLFLTQNLSQRPDVFVQVSIPSEFNPHGKFNIGITAGIESTLVHQSWLAGMNKMDMNIVPSVHSKAVFENTTYDMFDDNRNKIGVMKSEKPIEVLFEGADLSMFDSKIPVPEKIDSTLSNIKEDFNFLFVGHWLQGDLGHDRKDIGMLIKTFCETFAGTGKKPGLILKTSNATFSVIDRENLKDKIQKIKNSIGKNNLPNIYLLHGDLSTEEMNGLYNHKKVKAHVSFTKGEGYGRPLAEFALSGKPIIVSKWSGQVDFLPEQHTVFLEGSLTQVDESAADKFILKDSKWFTVNYSDAANKFYKVFNEYDSYLKQSAGLKTNILNNFTLEKMDEVFEKIMESSTKGVPVQKPFNLPTLNKNKMNIPKLNKV